MSPPVGIPLTASVLLTGPAGRLLLVRSPKLLRPWHLPGGLVEEGESPRRAARREVAEELGLSVSAGALLAVEWVAPRSERARARLAFVFAGPVLDPGVCVRRQASEIGAWRWETPARALVLLHHRIAARIAPVLTHPDRPLYLETERLRCD